MANCWLVAAGCLALNRREYGEAIKHFRKVSDSRGNRKILRPLNLAVNRSTGNWQRLAALWEYLERSRCR
jgi:hypothetical protein